MTRALVLLLLVGAVARDAAAHPLDLGYLRVQQTGPSVAITFDLDAGAAALLLHMPNADAQAVRSGAATLAASTYALAPITTPTGPCAWGPATAELVGRTATITSTATCPLAGERRWTFPFVLDHRISTKFELLVKEAVGDSERLTLFDPSKPDIVLATTSAPAAPRRSSLILPVVISVLGVCAFCAILLRWRRRRTISTT